MALLVTDQGDAIALKYLFNKSAPATLSLGLFTNAAFTAAKGDIIATLTECATAGYARVTILPANVTATTTAHVTTATATPIQFTFSATSTSNVTGYFVTDGTNLVYEEVFTQGGGYQVSSTQPLTVTLNITAN